MLKVAIQGIQGSFHATAAEHLLNGLDIKIVEKESFNDVFEAVASGECQYGVSAVENSLYGSINAVYKLLEQKKLWIAGETYLHINQYLIAAHSKSLKQYNNSQTIVMSQAPALMQCDNWLRHNLPECIRQESSDTAESVKYVVANPDKSYLAVASKQAADLYGGQIIAGPINDDSHNYTRFFLLQKNPVQNLKANKSSIILITDHQKGALYRALGVFNKYSINLSKLASHPIPGDKWHYAFYLDFEANLDSQKAQATLKELKEQNCQVQILGNYLSTTKDTLMTEDQ